jgi:hypothetical protein
LRLNRKAKNQRPLLGWFALGLMSLALAQDAEPLSEAFLLFLAEGIEVDGEWQDPVTLAASLAEMTGLQEISDDELVLIAEQDVTQHVDELREIENGEEDE